MFPYWAFLRVVRSNQKWFAGMTKTDSFSFHNVNTLCENIQKQIANAFV